MIYIQFQPQAFFYLYFFVIINLKLVDKYNKCKKNILEIIKFIFYSSNML